MYRMFVALPLRDQYELPFLISFRSASAAFLINKMLACSVSKISLLVEIEIYLFQFCFCSLSNVQNMGMLYKPEISNRWFGTIASARHLHSVVSVSQAIVRVCTFTPTFSHMCWLVELVEPRLRFMMTNSTLCSVPSPAQENRVRRTESGAQGQADMVRRTGTGGHGQADMVRRTGQADRVRRTGSGEQGQADRVRRIGSGG